MSIFLAFTLPFQELYFVPVWQSFAAVALVAICKMLEFQMSARVLTQLSAFELKAWLGVTLFVTGLIRRERCSKLNLIGRVICVIGVVAFQIV